MHTASRMIWFSTRSQYYIKYKGNKMFMNKNLIWQDSLILFTIKTSIYLKFDGYRTSLCKKKKELEISRFYTK